MANSVTFLEIQLFFQIFEHYDTIQSSIETDDNAKKSEFRLSADDMILIYDLCRYEIQAQSSDGSV